MPCRGSVHPRYSDESATKRQDYGIALREDQLAGYPVVAPVSCGSHNAYLDEVREATPADESTEAPAVVIAAIPSNTDDPT